MYLDFIMITLEIGIEIFCEKGLIVGWDSQLGKFEEKQKGISGGFC